MRATRNPGASAQNQDVLNALVREKQTGVRQDYNQQQTKIKQMMEEEEDEMSSFIEEDLVSEEVEQPRKQKKKRQVTSKQQSALAENNLYNYHKTIQPKSSTVNQEQEKASRDIMNSLFDNFDDEPEPTKAQPKNIFKTKLEQQMDEFDIPLSNLQLQKQEQIIKQAQNPVQQDQKNITFNQAQETTEKVHTPSTMSPIQPIKPQAKPQQEEPQKKDSFQPNQAFQTSLKSASKIDSKELMDQKMLSCYIFDLCDDPNFPGSVFLFGKVQIQNEYESVCVQVKNVQRQFFMVPNKQMLQDKGPDATFQKMEEELHSLMDKTCKGKVSDYRAKKVKRKYCFDLDIDQDQTQFMKVKYGFQYPQVNFNQKGKSYDFILGQSSSALELLILKKKIKGPCWINFLNFKTPLKKNSWCNHEFEIDSQEFLRVKTDDLRLPPLKIMGMQIQYAKNPENGIQEIIGLSAVQISNYHIDDQTKEKDVGGFSCVRPFQQYNIPYGFEAKFVQQNEFALINYFIAKMGQFDPDVIVGHYLYNEIFEILIARMVKLGIQTVSKFGRLRRGFQKSSLPIVNKVRQLTPGRLVCDTFTSSKELVKESDFSMPFLAQTYLNKTYKEITQVVDCYQDAPSLASLLDNSSLAAYLSIQLMFKFEILPLTKNLTNIAGNLWVKSLQNARAERNEMLLMHEFHKEKFIWPDKYPMNKEEQQEKKKAKYGGGLVLEPQPGLYERIILLLDFNSLYPSIIQEYSLCFTTVDRPKLTLEQYMNKDQDDGENTKKPDGSGDGKLRGILPRVIRSLVLRRKQVKQQMKNAKDEAVYRNFDIKQKAIKLIANSIYGCLGFKGSRFYAQPIAALITKTGREILQQTVDLVQNHQQFQIVYGDTDSIMINTNTDLLGEAIKIGQQIKKLVNKNYQYLEIEIDGLFQPLLLLKKKKYASMVLENLSELINLPNTSPSYKKEIKGLDMVRRDWSEISKKCSSFALDTILSGKPREEVICLIEDYLTQLNESLKQNKVSLKDFIITKQLTKAISEYKDIKSMPHVAVAQRLNQDRNMTGQFIHFVICKVENAENLSAQAFHPKEFQGKEIDFDYYKNQQIMPVLSRLCQHLEFDSIQRFARALGLDGAKYQEIKEADHETQALQIRNNDKVINMEGTPFNITCLHCKQVKNIQDIKDQSSGKWAWQCTCGQMFHPKIVQNVLTQTWKGLIKRYYDYKLFCKECEQEQKQTSLKFERCVVLNCPGKVCQKFTEQKIHKQILFFKGLFDYSPFEKSEKIDQRIKDICDPCSKFMDKLQESSNIRLKNLLKYLQ